MAGKRAWPRTCRIYIARLFTAPLRCSSFLTSERVAEAREGLVQWICVVERARCQGKRFLGFGSSRKFGLRRKPGGGRHLFRLRIDERVGVARADDAPAVLRPAEQVRPPLADARDPVHPGEDASAL